MVTFSIPRTPKLKHMSFFLLSLVAPCLRDPSCTLNDVMCESLCVFVHIVQLIWVGSLQNIINVLTKKHVESSYDSISKTKVSSAPLLSSKT